MNPKGNFVSTFTLALFSLFFLASCSGGSSDSNASSSGTADENTDENRVTEEEDCSAKSFVNGIAKRSRSGPEGGPMGEWGDCVPQACHTDFYKVAGKCVAVGNGYYSPSTGVASLKRKACTNGGNHVEYTSSGAGADNCDYACKVGYQKNRTGVCVAATTRSCSLVVRFGTATGDQTFNILKDKWEGACTFTNCHEDYYVNENDCQEVGVGYYSLASGPASLQRKACTNGGNHVEYTSSGAGADNCDYACKVGYQKNRTGVCVAATTRSCSLVVRFGTATGDQTFNILKDKWEGTCTFTNCHEDYYVNENDCQEVGVGYYSLASGPASLQRQDCGGLNGVIQGGQFTSSGRGEDSCSFTCNNDHHKDSNPYTCISNREACLVSNGLGEKTWNPSLNGNRGDWSNCQMIGCDEDFYQTGASGAFACTAVAHGEYSEANNFHKGDCTNRPASSTYTSSGSGSATGCAWACNEGYWRDGSTTSCEPTPINFYSEAQDNSKKACNNSNKPTLNSHYTQERETSQNCAWECDTGFVLDSGSCISSTILADMSNIKWNTHHNKPAEASYNFNTSFVCVSGLMAENQGRFHYKLYLKKLWLVNSDGTESGVFYDYEFGNRAQNLLFKGAAGRIDKHIAITDTIMDLLSSQRRASGNFFIGYKKAGGKLLFTAPEGTGASWNNKQIKVRIGTEMCYKFALNPNAASLQLSDQQEISFPFKEGMDKALLPISKGTLSIQDCFKASGSNHSITIDGITIDLGSNRLSRQALAQKIASTNFSSGGTQSAHPYSVTSNDNAEVIFTLNTPVTSSVSIPITDSTYTKELCSLQSCSEDYYLSGGFCMPVGNGYYSLDSGNNSLNRTQCNSTHGGTVTNGRFTSSGGGADNCDFACNLGYHKDGNAYACVRSIRSCSVSNGTGEQLWDPRLNTGSGSWSSTCLIVGCDEDFYENSGACTAVADGEYSVANSSSKGSCTGNPNKSKYTSDGGGIATGCAWACDAGYWKNGSVCEKTPRGFWSGDKDNQKRGCNAKPSSNVYTQEGEQTASCSNVPSSRSCSDVIQNGVATGTQTWDLNSSAFVGACTITSCDVDYSSDGDSCEPVGNGYYSVASGTTSLNKVNCGGVGGSIQNGQFTGSGGGSDNCPFTCNQNYHKSGAAYTCVSSLKTCNVLSGISQQVWNARTNSWGNCTIQSCEEDYYQDGNACVEVGKGFYSLASGTDSLVRKSCTNKPYNSEYKKSGGGSKTGCAWACNGGYYRENKTRICKLTSLGEYSLARNNKKFNCGSIPQNTTYTRLGEDFESCRWKCATGHILSDGNTCVQDNTLAGIDESLIFGVTYTPATLDFDWETRKFFYYSVNSFSCEEDFFLQKVVALHPDHREEFTFFHWNILNSHHNGIGMQEDIPTLLERLVSLISSKRGAFDSTFGVTRRDGTLQFVAPQNTGTEWNGRKIQFQSILTTDEEMDVGCKNSQSPHILNLPPAFSGGVSEYESATLDISDCLASSATNHSITIDGVSIDLGSDALTVTAIATTIANTNFSGGTLYADHPYTVSSADNGSGVFRVTFTLTNPSRNPTRPLYIEVSDSSYTKVSCSAP